MTGKYAVQDKPDLSFADMPHEKGMTYEFILKVRMPPVFDRMLKDRSVAPQKEDDPAIYTHPKKNLAGKVGEEILWYATGHAFFGLSVKKDGKEIASRDIGYGTDKAVDASRKWGKKRGMPSIVYDQENWHPTYHFSKSFPIERKGFDDLITYVKNAQKNPPGYHILAVSDMSNCANFARRCAKIAGVKKAELTAVLNMPMGVFAFIKAVQAERKLKSAGRKIRKMFSKDRAAPEPKKDRTASRLSAGKNPDAQKENGRTSKNTRRLFPDKRGR